MSEPTINKEQVLKELQQTLKAVVDFQNTQLSTTLKQIEGYINANETTWLKTIEDKFATGEKRIQNTESLCADRLDKYLNRVEIALSNLVDAQPPRNNPDFKEIVVKIIHESGTEEVPLEHQHPKFQDLLLDIQAGHNVYNYGPTGSGKTVAVYNAAKVLNLKVYRTVLNRETSPYLFKGYMKDNKYVPGLAFHPFVEGGILFADELDNGNANVGTTLKEFGDADEVWFGDTLYPKHKNFRLVANANTIGNGANQSYVGRQQQDKALLNIFKFHRWDYDEEFEYRICQQEYLSCGGDHQQLIRFKQFLTGCREFRKAVDELAILHIISPRNLKAASKDWALGRTLDHIKETILLKGLEEGQVTKIMKKLEDYNQGYLPKNVMTPVVS